MFIGYLRFKPFKSVRY